MIHASRAAMWWSAMAAVSALNDVNAPRGGVDKRCQIALRTDRSSQVIVSSIAKDWRTALDDALARAARQLLRALRRAAPARRPRGHTAKLVQ